MCTSPFPLYQWSRRCSLKKALSSLQWESLSQKSRTPQIPCIPPLQYVARYLSLRGGYHCSLLWNLSSLISHFLFLFFGYYLSHYLRNIRGHKSIVGKQLLCSPRLAEPVLDACPFNRHRTFFSNNTCHSLAQAAYYGMFLGCNNGACLPCCPYNQIPVNRLYC